MPKWSEILIAQSDGSQLKMFTQMRHIALWVIGEISSPEKECWAGLNKNDGCPQNFVTGSREFFLILSRALYWHWHQFPPAVRQNGLTSRVIPHNRWAIYYLTIHVVMMEFSLAQRRIDRYITQYLSFHLALEYSLLFWLLLRRDLSNDGFTFFGMKT